MSVKADFNLVIEKVAQFVDLATTQIHELRDEQRRHELSKTAEDRRNRQLVEKTAQLLYEADFIQDDSERRKFLKQAEADPLGVVTKALERVCKAAEVTLIGSPARLAAKPKMADYDPVAAKAFGWGDTQQSYLT